jgi:hypothetical protein
MQSGQWHLNYCVVALFLNGIFTRSCTGNYLLRFYEPKTIINKTAKIFKAINNGNDCTIQTLLQKWPYHAQIARANCP